jgi:hypothetical protein
LHRVRKNSLVECVWKPVDQTERKSGLPGVEDAGAAAGEGKRTTKKKIV